ncbi:hypothetical protein C8R43DRAFT_965196 [Mycena crocata]|nr:hypothetical protein C8R43DRAFT_965196 [Mycena crocata]
MNAAAANSMTVKKNVSRCLAEVRRSRIPISVLRSGRCSGKSWVRQSQTRTTGKELRTQAGSRPWKQKAKAVPPELSESARLASTLPTNPKVNPKFKRNGILRDRPRSSAVYLAGSPAVVAVALTLLHVVCSPTSSGAYKSRRSLLRSPIFPVLSRMQVKLETANSTLTLYAATWPPPAKNRQNNSRAVVMFWLWLGLEATALAWKPLALAW